MSKEVEGAAGGERLGFSLGLGLESDRGTSGESRLKVCWVRFLIVSFYAVTRHSMPRATRVLLLAPLFLRLAGLRAARGSARVSVRHVRAHAYTVFGGSTERSRFSFAGYSFTANHAAVAHSGCELTSIPE